MENELSTPNPVNRISRAVKWFLALSPLVGVVGAMVPPEVANLTFGLFGAGCLTSWCEFDSRHRGTRLSRWFGSGIFLLAVLFFPIYLLRSRGLRGLLLILPAAWVLVLGIVLALAAEDLARRLLA